MNISLLCVFVAFLLLYLTKIPVAVAMQRQPGGYDNRTPRDQQAKLEDWGRRALAAHKNAFETFAPFATAVILANLTHVNAQWMTQLALVFVAARVVYTVCYIAGVATLRSIIWMTGTLATAALFVLSLRV